MWHKGLTEKLKSYVLSESLVKWLQCYTSNRKQIVFINNSESRLGDVVAMIVWQLNLQLPTQSVPFTIDVVSSNRDQGEVYKII